jgi:hypothetical protein
LEYLIFVKRILSIFSCSVWKAPPPYRTLAFESLFRYIEREIGEVDFVIVVFLFIFKTVEELRFGHYEYIHYSRGIELGH